MRLTGKVENDHIATTLWIIMIMAITEGKFYWAKFDSIIDYWKVRNKQFLVRLWVTDDPGWNGAPGSTAFKRISDGIWQSLPKSNQQHDDVPGDGIRTMGRMAHHVVRLSMA